MAQNIIIEPNQTVSAYGGVSVTTTSSTTYNRSRGVYIGTSQNLDFSFDGTNWVTFQNLAAGSVIPLQVLAARVTSGPAAPSSGDVVFLY